MSNNAEQLTGNKSGKKDFVEKLKTFSKNVSVNIINEATDKDGKIDAALVLTGVAFAMDSILQVMSNRTAINKAILVSHFCRFLLNNVEK